MEMKKEHTYNKQHSLTRLLLAAFTCCLALLPARTVAADNTEGLYLYIQMTDGSNSKFLLTEQPVITFNDNQLIVSLNGKTLLSTEMEGIANCSFQTEQTLTGIHEVTSPSQEVRPLVNMGQAIFSGLKPGSTVTIHSADGKTVGQTSADSQGTARISLTTLSRGIYILRTNTHSFKVLHE